MIFIHRHNHLHRNSFRIYKKATTTNKQANKVVGYKIHMQKSTLFLHVPNEQVKT